MSQSALNSLRVLFVDDEAPIRDVMRIELPRMGHEVTICEDGQAAIAAIARLRALRNLRSPAAGSRYPGASSRREKAPRRRPTTIWK